MWKLRLLSKYWLPVLVWMWLIFTASGDRASFPRSSRIIGPFVHWLFPRLSEHGVHNAVVFVRKCAHLSEYAVLAWLLWRALRKPVRKDIRPWRWSQALWAALGVMLYAATDEFHQSFVPSRQASVADVLLDTSGGVLGLLLLYAICWMRQKRFHRAFNPRTGGPR